MMSLLAQAAQPAVTPDNDVYIIYAVLLLGAAIVLLLVEFFVPSGGLIGILCGIAAIGSVVAFYKYDPRVGIFAAIAYLVATPFLLVGLFKFWLHSPMAKIMILGADDVQATDEEASAKADQAKRERMAELQELIGLSGVTITALRPVGTVRIEGRRIDAMAESGVIEADIPVVVCDIYDNQVKVRPE